MQVTETEIVLGKKYRDTVLGLEGIATAHTKYLTGCDQVELQRADKGEIKGEWYDITRLEGVVVAPKDQKPGGPQNHAPARHR